MVDLHQYLVHSLKNKKLVTNDVNAIKLNVASNYWK